DDRGFLELFCRDFVRRTLVCFSTRSMNMVGERIGAIEAATEYTAFSAISWAAVAAGGVATAALMLLLAAFGAGMGFSTVSLWSSSGSSSGTFWVGTGIYLCVAAMLASTVGGYIAGRLRTRWTGLHTDEVVFRDTAHGFLAWATATVRVVAVIAFHSMVSFGAGTQLAANVAGGVASGATQNASGGTGNEVTGYLAATCLGPNEPARLAPAGAETDQTANAQITRIIGVGALQGEINKEDRDYL